MSGASKPGADYVFFNFTGYTSWIKFRLTWKWINCAKYPLRTNLFILVQVKITSKIGNYVTIHNEQNNTLYP